MVNKNQKCRFKKIAKKLNYKEMVGTQNKQKVKNNGTGKLGQNI